MSNSGIVQLFKPGKQSGVTAQCYARVDIHEKPVICMCFNRKYECVISADLSGKMEYWNRNEPFDRPPCPEQVSFAYLAETDLHYFHQNSCIPLCINLSPNNEMFVVKDSLGFVTVWNFRSGKMLFKIDENSHVYEQFQKSFAPTLHKLCSSFCYFDENHPFQVNDIQFGRLVALERELKNTINSEVIFDDSNQFIIYPTIVGIKSWTLSFFILTSYKVLQTAIYLLLLLLLLNHSVCRLLGKQETVRFLRLALFQGIPQSVDLSAAQRLGADTVGVETCARKIEEDPTLFATGFNKQTFYLFTKRYYEFRLLFKLFNNHNYIYIYTYMYIYAC
ncbi:hypothetical protein RFI_22617, partial [Reticulomyxa filosa]